MLLTIVFSETIDPSTVATVVLAAVAIVGLIFTWSSLKQTKRAIDLSQREVEEAHRPVIVPTLYAIPTVISTGDLAVPLSNIGTGPALHLEASAELLDAEGKPSLADRGEQSPAIEAGVGAGTETNLKIGVNRWTDGVSFGLTVTYEDVAGKRWQTGARYLAAHSRYEGLTIEPAPTPRR